MSQIQLTEYRVKPMFSEDFRLLWRKLHGRLKEEGLIGRAELFTIESSRIISIVEWNSDMQILRESPYKELNAEMYGIIDRRISADTLKRLESTL